jgi:hypothetical protein
MATEFLWFRNTVTGRVGEYPEHFKTQPGFEEISGYDALCLECPPAEVIADDGVTVKIAYEDSGHRKYRKRNDRSEPEMEDTEDN